MLSFKTSIKILFKKRLEQSSLIGLSRATNTKYGIIRIIWLFCTLASFSVWTWFAIDIIMDYLEFDVITTTEINYKLKNNFPVVTICKSNFIGSDFSNQYSRQIFGKYPSMEFRLIGKFLVNYALYSNKISSELIEPKLTDIIISCSYALIKCNLTQDFQKYYDFHYGVCYRFNSGKNMFGDKVERKYLSSFRTNLELELYTGFASQNEDLFSIYHGYTIFITNQTTNSLYMDGISISPGYSFKIAIKKVIINKKPRPFSACIDDLTSSSSYDSECYRKSFQSNQTYHFEDCVYMCLQKNLGDLCQCQVYLTGSLYYRDLRQCFNEPSKIRNDSGCFTQSLNNFIINEDIIKNCDCPIECHYEYFTTSTSFSEFPTKQYFNYIKNSTLIRSKLGDEATYQDVKESVVRIEIFNEDLTETVVNENAKTAIRDLVSSIGGLLGLFLGISFLSFVEFIDLFIEIFIILLSNSKIINSIQTSN